MNTTLRAVDITYAALYAPIKVPDRSLGSPIAGFKLSGISRLGYRAAYFHFLPGKRLFRLRQLPVFFPQDLVASMISLSARKPSYKPRSFFRLLLQSDVAEASPESLVQLCQLP